MPARSDAASLGVAALLLLCGAFIVSFVFGLGLPSRAAAPPVASTDPTPSLHVPNGRLEVLNASGRAGLARAATAQLRDAGFDVVHFGNASGFDGDSSVVVARTGDDTVARSAARHLGIGLVRSQRDTTLLVDATVVLGRDWARRDSAGAVPETWRVRFRRWFGPGQ